MVNFLSSSGLGPVRLAKLDTSTFGVKEYTIRAGNYRYTEACLVGVLCGVGSKAVVLLCVGWENSDGHLNGISVVVVSVLCIRYCTYDVSEMVHGEVPSWTLFA